MFAKIANIIKIMVYYLKYALNYYIIIERIKIKN